MSQELIFTVHMQAVVIKELEAKWLVACNDYDHSHPGHVAKGFKDAEFIFALRKSVFTPPQHDGTSSDEDETEDPFLEIHSHSD